MVVVKVKVSPDTDKEKIHQDFTKNYELALQAVEEKYKAVLAAKEEQIQDKDKQIQDKDKQIQDYLQDYRQQSADMMEITKLLASKPINVEAKAVAEQPTYDQRGASFGGGFAGRDYKGDVTHHYASPEQKQSLAEAAAEIQQLLEQLDKTYATDTVAGQMQAAQEAVKQIEGDTPLADRVLSAVRAGGTAALKKAIDHPATEFFVALLDDWYKTKSKTD
jgi:myosin heavy subunit